MDHLFIVNPVAGKGKSLSYIPLIRKIFDGRTKDTFIIEETKYPGHATLLVKEYTKAKDHIVWALGGDGTTNEVLNGMAHTESSLAIVPCGSGNDAVKSLDGYRGQKNILEDLLNGKKTKVDLGKINDRYFLNISSLGFDARVVKKTNTIKKIPFITGLPAYTLGVFASLISPGRNKIKLIIDGWETRGEILLIAVANGKYYGGGMQPAPMADIKDGILNVCMVQKISRLKVIQFLPLFMKGTHVKMKEAAFFEGTQIKVIPEGSMEFNIDGEISIIKGEMNFSIIPSGLNIILPK